MPGFICRRHGNTYMVVACPHIVQGVASGPLPGRVIVMSVDFGTFGDDPGMPMVFPNLYCPDCAEWYGLPSESTRVTDDEYALMTEVQLTPACADCFGDAVRRDGTKVGVPPPADDPVMPGGEA